MPDTDLQNPAPDAAETPAEAPPAPRDPAPAETIEERRARQLARLDRDDPAPAAQYTDRHVRVARAMLSIGADDGLPDWNTLRMRHKRVALADAARFLAGDDPAARLVNALLAQV